MPTDPNTQEMTPTHDPTPTHACSASLGGVQDQNQNQNALTTQLHQLHQLQQDYAQAQQTITALERRQRIDQLLIESDTIDLPAARLLTEAAVAQMDDADLALAVQDLKRHKPYLFHRRATAATLMPQRLDDAMPEAEQAAERAAQSGHRRDLLHYLRMRRQ